MLYDPTLHRIPMHVVQFFLLLRVAPQVEIKEPFLPKAPRFHGTLGKLQLQLPVPSPGVFFLASFVKPSVSTLGQPSKAYLSGARSSADAHDPASPHIPRAESRSGLALLQAL